MELGIYTFGDITPDPNTGRAISASQRYAEILAAAKLADEAGFHVFGVGEHPLGPPNLIAGSSYGCDRGRNEAHPSERHVTVLSTLDPVRVFQDFATVDLLSGGRAELIAGRGAYIKSFSLFGDDFANYDALFAEKLDLLLKLGESQRVTWNGRFRPPLKNSQISPRPANKFPNLARRRWQSRKCLRAGDLGLPVILANISQPPANFVTQIAAYRKRHAERGHNASTLKVAIATHVHVATNSQTALDEFYPHYSAYFREHAPRANLSGEVPREVYEKRAGPGGPIFVGSPQQIIDKLMYERELFAHDRFLGQVDIGALPYTKVARSMNCWRHKYCRQYAALTRWRESSLITACHSLSAHRWRDVTPESVINATCGNVR